MTAFRHALEVWAMRGIAASLRLLPLHVARNLGAWLGGLGYAPLRIRRRVVERQMGAAFPGMSEAEVAATSREAYRHLGRLAIELVLLRSLGRSGIDRLFEPDSDFGVVREALAEGRGAIIFTGHVGNWELTGAYIAAQGVPIDVVVRRMANPRFDAYLNETRAAVGMTVVHDHDAVRRIPRSLKEGRLAGLVADQGGLGLASSYVSFFGRPAKTPRGPAVFALRFGAPIVFVYSVLQPSGRYRLCAERIPAASSGNREADVEDTVRRFTRALERVVRQYPAQYFWHHRRWKRQPEGTPPELGDPVLDDTPRAPLDAAPRPTGVHT